MADLVVYSYNGPGEADTAETLAAGLPDDWTVIAGRALPTPQKDDVDLMVVGAHRVYTVEVKHWGPTIDVVNGGWRVKNELRASPVGRNSQVARIAASVLRTTIPGYKVASTGQHLVIPKVVLSHPDLTLDTTGYPYDNSQILRLDEAVAGLLAEDVAPTGLPVVRDEVRSFLSGLAARSARPDKLGPFTITDEVEGVGRARVLVGRDLDDDPIVLHAYPMDGWGPGVDVASLVRHERVATKRLAELQRAWSVESTLTDEVRRWVILPIRPVPSVSLARHTAVGQIVTRNKTGTLTERSARIVTDAFTALAESHQNGVIHRGLSPARVLIGKNDRVLLRDFYLAHASQEATIAPTIADTVDSSAPFRAPEVRNYIGAATPHSDVYSLALSLLWWINGEPQLTGTEAIQALATDVPPLGDATAILTACVGDTPSLRPTAADVVNALQPPTPTTAVTDPTSARASQATPGTADSIPRGLFVEGGTVGADGRYALQRVLGQGGFATSWLALDTNSNAARVIKQYTDPESAAAVQKEFNAAAKLQNPRCARVWDINPHPPVYLVSEYVAGDSLKDFGLGGTKDEDDYRKVALDALEGLAYMHSEDQLHRDVSPNNIIVGEDGRAVLIDFGLSADAKRAVSFAGTPPFIAPEVEISGTWTASADLYALGVSLLRTMLQRYPYLSDGVTFDKQGIEPLSEEEKATWGDSGVAVLQALFDLVEPDPATRPQSASEFAERLRTVSAPKAAHGTRAINVTVGSLRRLYRGSSAGNAGNRGLEDEFARDTYVQTRLDSTLTPDILQGKFDVILLTGNPGDGKTAFLAQLQTELDLFGASVEEQTAAGWRMRTGDRTYAAVYDASEARDGKTSDDLLNEALTSNGPHTALVAVNDGRLLSFFADHADVYEDCYIAVEEYARGKAVSNPRIAIVDLKRRSLSATDDDGRSLAGDVLAAFTNPRLWATCNGCVARKSCPILANRDLLAGAGRQPLLELVEISHLRRNRRATFRDVRSAFAWTITGDLDCEDVHAAQLDGRDLRLADNTLTFDLAFDDANPDYLVAEWALMNPTTLAAPSVERAIRDGSFALDTSLRPDSPHRQLFFDGTGVSPVPREQVRAYRYLDQFRDALAGKSDEDRVKADILQGLSRILGAHGYDGDQLALRDGESHGWSVLREIDATEFSVTPLHTEAPFVEQQPDGLWLSHKLGKLLLTLDSFELIHRAASGEILGDAGAEAVKLELTAFGDLLRRNPAGRVLVVNPAGRGAAVSIIDGVITRDEARS